MNLIGKAYQIQLILEAFILICGKDAKMADVIRRVRKCN